LQIVTVATVEIHEQEQLVLLVGRPGLDPATLGLRALGSAKHIQHSVVK
jgi:hypothetical protein